MHLPNSGPALGASYKQDGTHSASFPNSLLLLCCEALLDSPGLGSMVPVLRPSLSVPPSELSLISAGYWLSLSLCIYIWVSLVAQMVKNLPAVWETQVQSLSQEDYPGRGHGNPLQYSCLENPMDRGAWRATVLGIAKSRTAEAT